MQSFELWFGYMAVGLTISSFVPQVWQSVKTQSVRDLSIWTLIIFVCSSSCWLTYGLIIGDMPIILTNAIVFSLQLMLLILKIRYQPKTTVMALKIEHIAVWVKQLEPMVAFYERYFGVKKNQLYINEKKNFCSYFLSFDDSRTRIELMQSSEILAGDLQRGNKHGLTHFAISLGSESKVRALTEQLRSEGHSIIGEPRTTGDGYFESVVLDPENNHIELTV